MDDNSFEKFPGETTKSLNENELRAAEWQNAMSVGVPEFAGAPWGAPAESTGLPSAPVELGGLTPDVNETVDSAPDLSPDQDTQDNSSLSGASAIINYGLNAAAREHGVETVVQAIKNFDASKSNNPVQDLFLSLGVDTPAEVQDIRMEREAARPAEADFYQNSAAAPANRNRSKEGAYQAIQDMKELISEVEGADPRYEQLRNEARAAGKGYFEYAAGSQVNRGLTDLFAVLAAQPKTEENSPENQSENPENQQPETLNSEILRENSPETPSL